METVITYRTSDGEEYADKPKPNSMRSGWRKRTILLICCAAVAVMVLASCESRPETVYHEETQRETVYSEETQRETFSGNVECVWAEDDWYKMCTYLLPDGDTVDCLVQYASSSSTNIDNGMSCNWRDSDEDDTK